MQMKHYMLRLNSFSKGYKSSFRSWKYVLRKVRRLKHWQTTMQSISLCTGVFFDVHYSQKVNHLHISAPHNSQGILIFILIVILFFNRKIESTIQHLPYFLYSTTILIIICICYSLWVLFLCFCVLISCWTSEFPFGNKILSINLSF